MCCLHFLLLLLFSTTSTGNLSNISYRLPKIVVPIHYDVILNLQLDNFHSFRGSSVTELRVTEKSNNITLHAKDLHIELNSIVLTNGIDKLKAESIKLEEDQEFLIIFFSGHILGHYNLSIHFRGNYSDRSNGLYREWYLNSKNEKVWYVSTYFTPVGARRAFPCFDEPMDKATFNMSVIHDKKYSAISNMPVKRSIRQRDTIMTIFEKTPRMSTYLIAILVSDFQCRTIEGLNFSIWSRPDVIGLTDYAINYGKNALQLMERYTGIPFQIRKMDQVALPNLNIGLLSHWGIGFYREKFLLFNASINTFEDKQYIASTVSSMVAEQWFGNLVSPKWWKYRWLVEGFSRFFQHYIADKLEPSWRVIQLFVTEEIQSMALPFDSHDGLCHPLNEGMENPKEIHNFKSVMFDSGAIVRMMQHFFTDEIFHEGLQNYLNKYSHDVAGTDELYDALNEIAVKHNLFPGKNVRTIMNTWTNQKGNPVITVTRNYENGTAEISQERFIIPAFKNASDNNTYQWWVPINYATEGDSDFIDTKARTWLEPNCNLTLRGPFNANHWLILNKQLTGFYRVNYDYKNWMLITNFLNSPNREKIHVLNRAQLIDDALELIKAGQLDHKVLMDLTVQLSQETDYVMWYPVFRVFQYLDSKFSNSVYDSSLKAYLLSRMQHLVKSDIFREVKTDDRVAKYNREQIIKWCCYFGDKMCNATAIDKVNFWIKLPVNRISLAVSESALCHGLRYANMTIWKMVLDRYRNTTDADDKRRTGNILGCSSNSRILKHMLNLTLDGDPHLNSYSIISSILQNSRFGVDAVIDFFLDTWLHISKQNEILKPSTLHYVLYLIGEKVSSENQLKKLSRWAEQYNATDVTAKAIQLGTQNLNWLKSKDGITVLEWLKKFTEN